MVASVLSGLLAGVTLLPKQKSFAAVVAATSVLAFLLVIGEVINAPSGAKIDWALYLIIAFSLLQAIAAVGVVVAGRGYHHRAGAEAQVRATPQQYNPYSSQGSQGGYYGQHQPQRRSSARTASAAPEQQRQGYPQQYGQGGYPGGGPHTGGFPAVNPQHGASHASDRLPGLRPTAVVGRIPQPSGSQAPSQQPTQQTAQPQQSATQQSSPPPS